MLKLNILGTYLLMGLCLSIGLSPAFSSDHSDKQEDASQVNLPYQHDNHGNSKFLVKVQESDEPLSPLSNELIVGIFKLCDNQSLSILSITCTGLIPHTERCFKDRGPTKAFPLKLLSDNNHAVKHSYYLRAGLYHLDQFPPNNDRTQKFIDYCRHHGIADLADIVSEYCTLSVYCQNNRAEDSDDENNDIEKFTSVFTQSSTKLVLTKDPTNFEISLWFCGAVSKFTTGSFYEISVAHIMTATSFFRTDESYEEILNYFVKQFDPITQLNLHTEFSRIRFDKERDICWGLCEQLQALTVSKPFFGSWPCPLTALPNLTALDLTCVYSVGDHFLNTLTNLTTLVLDGNETITGNSLRLLTNLTKLSLRDNYMISDHALRLLTNLTELNLQENDTISENALRLLPNLVRVQR